MDYKMHRVLSCEAKQKTDGLVLFVLLMQCSCASRGSSCSRHHKTQMRETKKVFVSECAVAMQYPANRLGHEKAWHKNME